MRNTLLRRHRLLAFLALLLPAVFLLPARAKRFIDYEHKWIFPDKIDGLTFVGAEKYRNPAQGYGLFFKGGADFPAKVELYIFPGDFDTIPDGPASPPVQTILSNRTEELRWKKKNGAIRHMRYDDGGILPTNGPVRFACRKFVWKERGSAVPRFEADYVTGIGGRIWHLKISSKGSERWQERVEPKIPTLVEAIAAVPTNKVSAEELTVTACDNFLEDPASFSGLLSAQYLMAQAQEMGNLNVYTNFFVWPQSYYAKPKNADLLIAGYFAGMLKVVVPKHLDEGGEYEAFLGMLETYKKLRKSGQIRSIEKLDEWVKEKDKKALFRRLIGADEKEE